MEPNNQNPLSYAACLESQVDQLESELTYLDNILMRSGFPDGITSLKLSVEELLVEEATNSPSFQEKPFI